MASPEYTLGLVANLFSKQMRFLKEGDVEHGHTHPFDHLTLLASGGLSVEVDGEVTDFEAPHMLYIRADKKHTLTALEDNTVAYCIHALRDEKYGDILDPSMIPKGVRPRDVVGGIVDPPDWEQTEA